MRVNLQAIVAERDAAWEEYTQSPSDKTWDIFAKLDKELKILENK